MMLENFGGMQMLGFPPPWLWAWSTYTRVKPC